LSEVSVVVREALQRLGIDDLVLIVHDASFPGGDPGDLGRGSPYSAGGRDLLRFAVALGFNGVQLGPQGQTSRDDPSPYDGTVFSKSTLAIDFSTLTAAPFAGVLAPEDVGHFVLHGAPSYAHAFAAANELLTLAYDTMVRSRERGEARALELSGELQRFSQENDSWLRPDALYAAICGERAGCDFAEWPERERDMWLLPPGPRAARLHELSSRHARVIERYAFGQYLVSMQHAALRRELPELDLIGDLQVGYSRQDLWRYGAVFLDGYLMGAPPSRTNPEGQPWGYPVLDPAQCRGDGSSGLALALLLSRFTKVLGEYDRVRIDHPHGLVSPWVYKQDDSEPLHAVQTGARLLSSPDLPDHPRLSRFAVPRPDQLDRTVPRHADGWVRQLEELQVDRYAVLLEAMVARARREGRDATMFVCEVLSTQPYELGRVLERFGLGRFRVTQKANVKDPHDVYRGDNAKPEDWIMLGNHDTPPIWLVAERWQADNGLGDQAAYLAQRLAPRQADLPQKLAADVRALVEAKAAELFIGPAKHVMIFWTDLFGERAIYNRPGTVDPRNWSLRLPPDYRARYAERLARGEALSLPRLLAIALAARGDVELAAPLEAAHRALCAGT
jgi:4-alpha-glucanotransferase